jgi:Uma2 family endonuclease
MTPNEDAVMTTRLRVGVTILAMTQPADALDPVLVQHTVDQRVVLRNVCWNDYEAVLAMRGDRAVPRIAYLEGTLEFMTPSRDHEVLKKKMARLLEAYAEELQIPLEGYGSWTLRRRERERGLEPDECYSIGPTGDVPDLAIEVVWTSGGLDKLEIYRLLGVREVWVWQQGAISLFALRGEEYVGITASEVLPQVDIERLRAMLDVPTQTAAVRELRRRLRTRP